MTERLCTPLHSRACACRLLALFFIEASYHACWHAVTSELMFEQYSVPSLAYCVDGVMSFYHNNLTSRKAPFTSDGLVISFNTASTSVIPILSGKGIMSHAKRLVLFCFSNGRPSNIHTLGYLGVAHNHPITSSSSSSSNTPAFQRG
jgi:actin-related protein 5